MKRTLALLATTWMAVSALQLPANADDAWFNKYDRNHDGHWTYQEFRSAHTEYWKHHRQEQRLTDAELRAEFDRRASAHPGWVAREEVRDFHNW